MRRSGPRDDQGDVRHAAAEPPARHSLRRQLLLPARLLHRHRGHALLRDLHSRRRGTRVPGRAPVSTGVQVIVTPFIPKLINRFGKKTLFQYAGILTVVGGVGLFLTPDGIVWFALLCLGIKGVGFSLINTLMFALEPDTVEYGEWKSGKRSEGATYAIFSFTRKLTQSIGGAATAWALALGGYVSATAAVAAPEQPESALTAIKVVFGLVPAAAAILAMIVFITYPLTDQRFREVRDETEARKRELEHAVLGDHGAV